MRYLLSIGLVAMMVSSTPPAWATTYYTKKTGSNSNTCSQAQAELTAKLTIAAGLGCLAAGDTLIIGDGTYVESVTTSSLASGVNGTSTDRITIQAQNRRQVIVAPGGAAIRGLVVNRSYVTVQGIIFDCTATGPGDGATCVSNNVTSTNGVWLLDNEFMNSPGGGIFAGGNSSDWRIQYNTVHDNGTSSSYGLSGGMYLQSLRNAIISRNEVYGNECTGIRLGNSGTFDGDATGNVVEYNYIHNNGNGFGGVDHCTSDGAGVLVSGVGNTIRHNLIVHQYRGGIWFYNLNSTNPDANNSAYNNTIYDVSYYGIRVAASHTGVIYRNNHIASAALGATFADSGGSAITSSNNRTTGAITDCTVSTSNFTQKAGSACIDAGLNVGFPFNGSAPDIGAFETFLFSVCEVPTSAAGTIQINFINNANPPLGDTLTTFTARLNGSSNALTGAASKIGDNIVSLPLTTTYVGGDSADISWSSGGLTDSTLLGNSINQPYVTTLTNQSCTNNAGGVPAYAFSQVRYQYRGVFGPETTTDTRGDENVSSFEVVRGGAVRVRFAVVCSSSDCPPSAFFLRYSTDGVTYTVIPDTFATDHIAACGSQYGNLGVENGVRTTNQLSTAGTFIFGGVVLNSNAIPTISGLNNGFKTELEYCVAWDSSATGTYTLRVYEQTGSAIIYTVTPTVTIVNPRGTATF